MNESAQLLAARKELLLARSALYRLKVQGEVVSLRASLSWARTGMAVAGALPLRDLAFGAMLSGLGTGRLGRLLAAASRALVFARIAMSAVRTVRERSTAAGAREAAAAVPARSPGP